LFSPRLLTEVYHKPNSLTDGIQVKRNFANFQSRIFCWSRFNGFCEIKFFTGVKKQQRGFENRVLKNPSKGGLKIARKMRKIAEELRYILDKESDSHFLIVL